MLMDACGPIAISPISFVLIKKCVFLYYLDIEITHYLSCMLVEFIPVYHDKFLTHEET